MTDEEKEIEEWITERRKGSDLMSKLLLKNKELKKENAELKAKLNHTHCVECAREYLKEIGTLKAQIEQLSNDNHVLKTSFITQQEQIEKMKCCGNCKWYRIENGGETFCDCVGDCIDFSNWELAE